MKKNKKLTTNITRREFAKKCLLTGGNICVGYYAWDNLLKSNFSDEFSLSFKNSAPNKVWKWSKEAYEYTKHYNHVKCNLCPHGCVIGENDRGFCRVRVNKNNTLHTLVYGNPCAYNVDPIEKKPLYHFLPGTGIFSIATAGCNFRCNNCQNWQMSQSKPEEINHGEIFPNMLPETTLNKRCRSIAYTYSEPIIFYEYMYDTAIFARKKKVKNVMVTAGYINKKPMRKLAKFIDGANVDVKGFSDEFYVKATGGRLWPVLDAIEIMVEEGVWVEITNLLIPTLNDTKEMIKKLSKWIFQTLGPNVPLHFSRFQPEFKLKSLPPTPVETLIKARDIALNSGLKFVYIGNLYGYGFQNTYCPNDGFPVIERKGYMIERLNIDSKGRCVKCKTAIPGVWG